MAGPPGALCWLGMELPLLRRLVGELATELVGARADRIYAVPRYHLVVSTSPNRGHLWISVEPEDPHVWLRTSKPRVAERPPAFAMAARKWGRGRRIDALRLVGDDRVLQLAWSGGGSLVAELVPRRSTAFVLDDQDQVVAVWNPRRGRPGVGEPYEPPAPRSRCPHDGLDEAGWERLEKADEGARSREMVRTIEGLSPSLAAESIHCWQRDGGSLRDTVAATLQRAANAEGAVILSAAPVQELRRPVDGAKLILADFALEHRARQCAVAFPTVSDAASCYYDLRARLRLLNRVHEAAAAAIRDRRDHIRRKGAGAEAPDDAAARATSLRREADMLLAAPNAVASGSTVEVPDLYGGGSTVRIRIDPEMDLAANADRMYRRAQRIERHAARSQRTAALLRDELAQVDRLEAALAELGPDDDLDGFLSRLEREGMRIRWERLRDAEAGTQALVRQKPEDDSGPGAGILRVQTAAGHEVLIGRNARANDRLTHEVAARHDWWLHAEGPGSHVVLRNPRRLEQPPPDALAEAAALAAWFSKARGSGKVEVHWTQARRIRKPRNAPAGTALMERFHSYLATPRPPAEVGDGDG